jgi:RNA recognition motif-containing protein
LPRRLHVGNVPLNLTEVQLLREFERFGQLDGLKLISQRSGTRRFAFITFHTVEQAITAKHCMSKMHPWKSAISFAHKYDVCLNHQG